MSLVQSLYTDFNTSIISSEFNIPFIRVGRGVLQGDCLNPLLFNMCFNMFIQHFKDGRFLQFGFFEKLAPIHWCQFADDAAVISGQESENKILLNHLSIWFEMIIRLDKCSTFGLKKCLTKSVQYQPKLIVKNAVVPPVKPGESFRYLDRYFDFVMSSQLHKTELLALVKDLLTSIDLLSLHPKKKLVLYNLYLLSKISWHFTVANHQKHG